MMKSFDFSLRPLNKSRPGFSLVELMATMVILGLILGAVSSGLEDLRRFSREYLRQTLFETPYLIFLLKLEEDYQEAEISLGDLDNMRFYKDINMDGDHDDKAERIEYRWNKSAERIDRKSRKTEKSPFQAFLEGVDELEWNKIPVQYAAPVCHQIKVKPTLSSKHRVMKYCRSH